MIFFREIKNGIHTNANANAIEKLQVTAVAVDLESKFGTQNFANAFAIQEKEIVQNQRDGIGKYSQKFHLTFKFLMKINFFSERCECRCNPGRPTAGCNGNQVNLSIF